MMEGLTPYTSQLPAQQQSNPVNMVGQLLLKIKLKLSRNEFESALVILQSWVFNQKPMGVEEMATVLAAYKLAEKMRRKMPMGKKEVKLSLDVIEANALYEALDTTIFYDYAVYETNLVRYILSQINQQTV